MNRKTRNTGIRKLHSWLLAVPLLLGACSGEDITDGLPQSNNTPIGFDSSMPETKAVAGYAAVADPTDIGVFAYLTRGNFDESTATPNCMYNQLVSKQADGSWSYTPVRYWPNSQVTGRISFFAYAPYTGKTSGNLSFQDKETASGFPVLSYTVPQTESRQIDLLAAPPVMNRNSGNISFTLYHTLTKINIYIKSKDDTTGKSVTAFSITGMKSGMLTYCTATTSNVKGWQWSYPQSGELATFTADATNFPVPDTAAEEKKLLATFYLLPNTTNCEFNITYQYTEKDKNNNTTIQSIEMKHQAFPSTDNWLPGTPVGYTIGIARKAISITPEDNAVSWEDDAATEIVTGTES